MKKVISVMCLLLPLPAAADTFQTTFPVKTATIYPQGALLDRLASVEIPAGSHEVQLLLNPSSLYNGLPKLDVEGAQLDQITISMIGFENPMDFATDAQKILLDEIDAQTATVKRLTRSMEELAGIQKGLATQRKYIAAMRPSSEAPQSFEEIQNIIGLIPTALAENAAATKSVKADIFEARLNLQEAQEKLDLLLREASLFPAPDSEWPIAKISVTADAATTLEVTAEEFTQNAGWSVSYDLFLVESAGEVEIERTANLFQSTGENWEDVKVTLSSAKPNQVIRPRIPQKDVVQMLEETRRKGISFDGAAKLGSNDVAVMESEAASMFSTAAPAPVQTIAGTFDGVAVEYPLANPITMLHAIDRAKQVKLDQLVLEAEIDRFASPRHDKHAFVRATVENTTGEPLLSGDAKTYRDDNLVGTQRLSLLAAGAEVEWFFGPDQTLPLTMTFLSEMSGDTGFISRSNTRQEIMEFEIQNLGVEDQDVVISYALPISENEDIKVRTTAQPKPDAENVDGVKGRSEWNETIEPGETRKFALDVQVTWPDGSQIHWNP